MSSDESGTRPGQSDVVPLADEEGAATLIRGAIQGLWAVVNQLTRLRLTRRDSFRVTIFGSARLAEGTPEYDAVKDLAARLAANGLRDRITS